MARVPPLNWLRAFDAAARASSISKGARELHVTPSAVSQHVRRLEEALGVKLLWREGNKVRLSAEGQRLSQELHVAFSLIARAVEPFGGGEANARLVARAPAAFGGHWLGPRLAAFTQANPTVDIVLQATERSRRLDDEAADVEILYGDDSFGEGGATFLFRDWAFPACAPDYLSISADKAPDPERTRLLCNLPPPFENWRDWMDRFGGGGGVAGQMVDMPRVEGAVEAAVHGIGLCLLPTALAADSIAGGRLVMPFEGSLRARNAYWLVRHCREEAPGLSLFLAWLDKEVRMFNEMWNTS